MKAVTPLCAAGLLVLGTTLSAAAQAQSSAQSATSGADEITVSGCVQREADYRKTHDAGRGGVAGTGVGAGNEFVLVDASNSASGSSATTGTSGSSAAAYELTGPNEGKVGSYINKRVEITGKLKAAEVSASNTPTGGATAGEPPKGVDVMSKDLKLRELEVSTVREASGTCPAK